VTQDQTTTECIEKGQAVTQDKTATPSIGSRVRITKGDPRRVVGKVGVLEKIDQADPTWTYAVRTDAVPEIYTWCAGVEFAGEEAN
jgi:hypothetical protein